MPTIRGWTKLAAVAALGGALALGAAPDARAGFVTDGVDYFLAFQDPSTNHGGFIADADHNNLFYPTNQGRFGSAMLAAYFSSNSSYLNKAKKLGNAIIDADNHTSPLTTATPTLRSQLYFNSGTSDPMIPTQTSYFLLQLSQVTGDTTYSNYVKVNLWNKLTAGTYGPDSSDPGYTTVGYGPGGVNTAGYIGHLQGISGWDFLPWFLAKTAVAANMAGETAIRDDLFNLGIIPGLENAAGGYGSYDVYALAAAVWASAVTGVNLNPSGHWTASTTAQLANMLLNYSVGDGGFFADSCGTLDTNDSCYQTSDAETTAAVIAALHVVDPYLYQSYVDAGLTYLENLQLPNGYVPTFSDTDAAHADVLQEFFSASIPEPTTAALIGFGLIGLGVTRRRRAA